MSSWMIFSRLSATVGPLRRDRKIFCRPNDFVPRSTRSTHARASNDPIVQINNRHRVMKYDDLEAKGGGGIKSLELSTSPASLRQQKYCCSTCGKYLGLFYMFMSAVCFSTMSMLVGFLGRVHAKAFPFAQLVFARGILCLVLAFAYIRWKNLELFPKDKHVRSILFTRCFIGQLGMLGTYMTLTELELSEATVIIFTAPFWTILLAFLILKEPFSKLDRIACVVGMVGLFLVTRPTPESIHGGEKNGGVTTSGMSRALVIILGILGALASAGTNLLVRKLKTVDAIVTVFYLMVAAILGSSIVTFASPRTQMWESPATIVEYFALVGIGLMGFAGQMFKTTGLKLENAGPGAMMRLTDLVLAPLFQLFVFKEPIHPWTAIGIVVILIAGSLVALSKVQRQTAMRMLDDTT